MAVGAERAAWGPPVVSRAFSGRRRDPLRDKLRGDEGNQALSPDAEPAFPHLPQLRWVPFLSRLAGEDVPPAARAGGEGVRAVGLRARPPGTL